MSPPGLMANPQASGGSTGTEAKSQVELAIRAAHKALNDCGVQISPRKVNRIVRKFAVRAKRDGWTFHQFLSGEANLQPEQRRRLLASQEFARCIAYLDPVGDRAARDVDREKGW